MFINPYKKGRIRSWVLELARIDGPLFGFTCILFLNCFCFRRLSRVNCEPKTNEVLGEQLK